MEQIQLEFQLQEFPLANVFRIARGAKTSAQVVEVQLTQGKYVGRGESVPYQRYNESLDTVSTQLEEFKQSLAAGEPLDKMLLAMPAGSAKNALDCAYLDLKAKVQQTTVEQLLDLEATPACITAQTLSIDTPEAMAKKAAELEHPPLIKVKLDNEDILGKMTAIFNAAPYSKFIVDANEGWTIDDLKSSAETLAKLNVVLIEQPLPVDEDAVLTDYDCPVSLCADESCHTRKELDYLKGKYQAINIKLDKTGGLTEGLALYREAKEAGFDIMVGCMVGSSLAMAPAFLLTSGAKFVDLDGPLIVAEDRPHGFVFKKGVMHALDTRLWGGVSDQEYPKF